MSAFARQIRHRFSTVAALAAGAMGVLASLAPLEAQALPLFARQTGQNCVSCHAGGQFPELTPYGRMFKLTGYTIGKRVDVPLAAMGLITYSKVRDTSKSDDPPADFQKNGSPLFSGGSIFIGGKVTDNIGAFVQWTYDNYAGRRVGSDGNTDSPNGTWQGKPSMDNIDLRYADRFVDANRDLIVGFSLNNNPSVADPWNTAAAWEQYVPVPSPNSSQFIDGASPYPGFGAGQAAGMNAYMYLNKMLYAELGLYQTANRGWSFMSAGTNDANTTKLRGVNNPYVRVALTHEWGPHNVMVGASGMIAHVFDPGTDISDPGNAGRVRNTGVDAQYQYLLDPHTVTAQVVYMKQKNELSPNAQAALTNGYTDANGNDVPIAVDANGNPMPMPNTSNTFNVFRAKLSYVYQAKYGGSLSFFNRTGTIDSAAMNTVWYDPAAVADPNVTTARVTGSLSGSPATRGFTYEAFWMPVQYVRVGAQYTAYNKFNGAGDNYDGMGRNARDNNSLFFYIWGAY